nr:hypothetical protein [Methanobrevibacter arboriphilus]
MKPEEFKEAIMKQAKKYKEFIKIDDYDNNPYYSFDIKMKQYYTMEDYMELTIDNTLFICHDISFNGFTDDVEISDKYSSLNGMIIARVKKVSEVKNVKLYMDKKRLILA